MTHWTNDPANLVKAMEKVAFEAHSLALFASLCRCGVACRAAMTGNDYQRSLFDHAFEYTFYVHLRSLLDFLHLRPNDDDVSCEHFGQAVMPYRDTNLKKELNKRLAHITAYRFATNQPASLAGDGVEYYVEHAEEVYKEVERFVASLNDDQLKRAYLNRFAELDADVRKIGLALPPHFALPSVF